MNCLWIKLYFFVVFILVVSFAQDIPISEPKSISVTPVNSTALRISWQFLNSTFDQSDRVDISINIFEFFYTYNFSYPPINYTYGPTNKTATSLTKNFPLVNAFYFICFASNSTRSNSSRVVPYSDCFLTQTCLRTNASICPSPSFIVISSSSISSNSFVVTIHWLKRLAYLRQTTTVQLLSSTSTGTSLNSIDNDTYTSFPYRFNDLQSFKVYTINVTVQYLLFDRLLSETKNFSITTSRSTNVFDAGEGLTSMIFLHLFLVFILRSMSIED